MTFCHLTIFKLRLNEGVMRAVKKGLKHQMGTELNHPPDPFCV